MFVVNMINCIYFVNCMKEHLTQSWKQITLKGHGLFIHEKKIIELLRTKTTTNINPDSPWDKNWKNLP